jgi:DHA1 family solute carrier family 18 vesicular amine transporter 1/2
VRRLLVLISAFMFLELFFFAVLSPLLPGLKHDLRLSTSQAGVLVAMYALGALVGAIPATLVALRAGVKTTALASLVAFAAMSVAFGLAGSYEALLLARFAQGLAGAALWTAAMVWLLEAAPAARRGEMLGFAFGVSEAGAVAGPAIGGVAAGAGRASTFVAIAVICVGLALIAMRAEAPKAPADRRLELGSMGSSASVRTAMGIALLPAVLLAAISVLAPLQQHALGAGAGEIAAIFGIAALGGVLVRPAFGRWSDRRGPLRPIRLGLLASAPVVLGVPWLDSRVAAAALTIAALVLTGVLWAPLMVMLSDACTAAGVGQIMAVVIIDLTWPPGNALGAAGAAAIAQAAGQRWAYATMAAALLAGYLALARSRGQLAGELQAPAA